VSTDMTVVVSRCYCPSTVTIVYGRSSHCP